MRSEPLVGDAPAFLGISGRDRQLVGVNLELAFHALANEIADEGRFHGDGECLFGLVDFNRAIIGLVAICRVGRRLRCRRPDSSPGRRAFRQWRR